MATCTHPRRRVIAQDDVLEFAECEDCGEILELPAPDPPPRPPEESLSDA